MTVLSPQDRDRLEAVIKAAEARTSAEFALVVMDASDDYVVFPLLWAAVAALVAGGVLALVLPHLSAAVLFAVQTAIFVVLGLLFHLRRLRPRLAPERVKRAHATRMARMQFAALVHDRTREETGILLFVSLAERHVEIIPDGGIAGRVAQAEWERIIAGFLAEVRAGRLVPALTSAVSACVAVLEEPFPPGPGRHNEISDRVTEA
jgi:putative membrane protein